MQSRPYVVVDGFVLIVFYLYACCLSVLLTSTVTAQPYHIWNDRIITDLDEIANKCNAYFINIGQSLSEQIHATRSSDEYLNNRTNTVFIFTEVNEECIDSI